MHKEIIVNAYYTGISSKEVSQTAILPQTLILNNYAAEIVLRRMPMPEPDEIMIEGQAIRTGRVSRVNVGTQMMHIEPKLVLKRPSLWQRIKNIFL